jgi:hypothetical protein
MSYSLTICCPNANEITIFLESTEALSDRFACDNETEFKKNRFNKNNPISFNFKRDSDKKFLPLSGTEIKVSDPVTM